MRIVFTLDEREVMNAVAEALALRGFGSNVVALTGISLHRQKGWSRGLYDFLTGRTLVEILVYATDRD